MTPLPLLVVVLLVVATLVAVLLLRRRRRTRPTPAGPRTVAELVELRATAPPARVTAPARPEPPPEPGPAVAAAAPVAAPVVEPPPPTPPAPVPAARTRAVVPVPMLGDDVPWRRGALMHGTGAGLAEPRPAAAVPARAVPVPRPPAGSTRRDHRTATPDRHGTRPTPRVPASEPVAATIGAAGRHDPAARAPGPPAAVDPPSVAPRAVDPPGAGSSARESTPRGSSVREPAPHEPAPRGSSARGSAARGSSVREPAAAAPADLPAAGPAALPAPAAPRPTAEQAAADLALLRTFGAVDLASRPDRAPDVELASTARPEPEPEPGTAQPVRFRVVRRGGEPIADAAVVLLDAAGRETATAHGASGELTAPRPGGYVLVATAAGHQTGALALVVAHQPVPVELLLVRSAVLRGSVTDEDGPVAGARVTLVQDGEVVESADGDGDGTYRIEGLAAGEYAVSVAAAGCEPDVELVGLTDEAEVVHDVELAPARVAAARGPEDG